MSPFWKKAIVLLTATSVLSTVLIVVVILPNVREILSMQLKVVEKQKDVDRMQAKLDSLKTANRSKESINRAYLLTNDLWPSEENVSQFLVQVEGLATEKAVALSDLTVNEIIIQPPKTSNTASQASTSTSNSTKESSESKDGEDDAASKKKAKGSNDRIQFMMSGNADYTSLIGFIVSMERLARFNSISSINVFRDKENHLNFSLNGHIYGK
ncbi:MAG: hypothetical protein BWY68_00317 [bacterium ADurb.Bin400]|nr:MAG: hypothetical protein BWY68_00317 [bacterium ADurb.Bin400]